MISPRLTAVTVMSFFFFFDLRNVQRTRYIQSLQLIIVCIQAYAISGLQY